MMKKAETIVGSVLLSVFVAVWGSPQAFGKTFTVGMILYMPIHEPAALGFKEGMAKFGYVDGENIRYIYSGISETSEKIDAAIVEMLAQKVDLFFTAGNPVTLRVKAAVEGRGIPVLMTATLRPVQAGIVESIGYPGQNVTGVRVHDTAAKTLEWLRRISPDIRRVFVPFNPHDEVSDWVVEALKKKASKIGTELVCRELFSVEEAVNAILQLPEDMDAILRIPSPTLDLGNSELSQAAIRKRIPMAASFSADEAVLLTCATDMSDAGEQNARLARLIHLGVKPSELPVETADPELTINLRTAEKVGVYIPDEILLQVDNIIR
jgi:putative ABC transport system substrate-binding protein